MRRRWGGAAAILAAGVALAAAGGASEPADGGIAVVDLEKVFERYRKREDLETVLARRYEELKQDIQKTEQELKTLRDKLAMLEPGTEEHRRTQEEVFRQEAKFKVDRKQYTDDLNKQSQSFFDDLLDEITDEVRAMARRKGYRLVLQRGLKIQDKPWVSVLYCGPELDITEDVVEVLNGRYARTGGKKEGARGEGEP